MKPENPYKNNPFQIDAWQEGFDVATKYWNEPCTKHPVFVQFESKDCYRHRFDCPECRKEAQC